MGSIARSGGIVPSAVMGVPGWRHVDLLPEAIEEEPEDNEEDPDEMPFARGGQARRTESGPGAADDDEVEALFERGQAVPVHAGSP